MTAGDRGIALALLDPSIDSANTGDLIIAESVAAALPRLGVVAGAVPRLPTQRRLTADERSIASNTRLMVVGGTNLLSSNMPFYRQWKINYRVARQWSGRVTLMGVGWWQYQQRPNRYTAALLRAAFDGSPPPSVRDSYTRARLAEVGVESINTGCPTMWALPEAPETRRGRAGTVVMTVTDYHRDAAADTALHGLLKQCYDRILIWPQGRKDESYLKQLRLDSEVIAPTLAELDHVLAGDVDYVGTRLHAGVRALQNGRRATVIAVDNRAPEIASDTGLPVIKRDRLRADWSLVVDERDVRIRVPHEAISEWCAAVSHCLAARH